MVFWDWESLLLVTDSLDYRVERVDWCWVCSWESWELWAEIRFYSYREWIERICYRLDYRKVITRRYF